MGKLVSAIITTHNRSALLKRAIDSILSQTYNNIECIVVDDNSADNTKELCLSYSNLKYIYIPENESRGGNYARNLGVKHSCGSYIAFLDDDDYWLPEKIEKQIHLINNSVANVIYCGRTNEIVTGESSVFFEKTVLSKDFSGNLKTKIFTGIPTTTSALLIDRKSLFDVGLFDESIFFWQEYDLMIRLAQISEFAYVDEPLLVYRIDKNDKQRLTNKYKPWLEAVDYVRKKHCPLIDNLSLNKKLEFRKLIASDGYMRLMNSHNTRIKYKAKIKYYYSIILCKLFK